MEYRKVSEPWQVGEDTQRVVRPACHRQDTQFGQATQGLEGQDVYVVAEDKARLWRERRIRDEVPDAERTPPQP